jgi:hypothetical protein
MPDKLSQSETLLAVIGRGAEESEIFCYCEEQRSEAIHTSTCREMDYFAEPVIGGRFAPTRWLVMTTKRAPKETSGQYGFLSLLRVRE